MASILSAHNVAKVFSQPDGSKTSILKDISLELVPGEVVCLLGASGCGKTTLLHILAGLDTFFEGKITSLVQRPGPTLGYLSQHDRLIPWRSVKENVSLGLELLGRSRQSSHAFALNALERVKLSAFGLHHPVHLSGGMQQRALLARMLALEPRLLLLDEPMSSLDVPARRDLASIIKDYTRSHHAATLVVTHSVEEACFLADRILLISRSPAVIAQEIKLHNDSKDTLSFARGEALDSVMESLCRVLGAQP